jgi:hypothetical protein
MTLAVEHGDVDLHEIGPSTKGRLRHGRLGMKMQRDGRAREEGNARDSDHLTFPAAWRGGVILPATPALRNARR